MQERINHIKEVFQLAELDGKCRKKPAWILFFLSFFSLLMFLMVNSIINSISQSLEDIIHKPYGRIVNIMTQADTYEEEMEYYRKVFAEESGIGEIFWHIPGVEVTWDNSDILGVRGVTMQVMTKITAIDKYVTDGSVHIEKGEILIPQYLYGLGNYNDYTYADGRDLIGKQIELTVKNKYMEECCKYTFMVAGTYDNVRASTENNMFCLCEEDALEIYEYMKCYGEEAYINEVLQEYGLEDDGEAYESLRQRHYIGFYINEDCSFSDVCDQIEKTSGEACFPFLGRNETLINFYRFVVYLSNIIVAILGTTAIIILITFVVRDLRSRYGQIAMRYACGYPIGFQISAFVIEKVKVIINAALAAVLATVISVMAGNYIIQNVMPFYRRNIVLNINWNAMFIVLAGITAGSLLCLVFSFAGMRKLNIAETLKREER